MPTKILALHHVLARPEWPVGPQADARVSPAALRAYLRAGSGWTFVDHRRALDPAASERRQALVTIDDGYRDALTEALPVLESVGAPFLLFVVTGWLDGAVRPMESDLGWIAGHLPAPRGERLYRLDARRLRRMRPQRQAQALRQLARRHGVTYPPPREETLSWDELAELARHPLVTIGSHSVSHPSLGFFDARLAAREAAASRERLETMLGREVECFSYPYGRHGPLVRRAVARAGYRFAFTTRPALVTAPARLDRMAIPRHVIDGSSDSNREAEAMREAA